MKTARKSAIVVGAVLALAASQVMAQPGPGWGRGPRHAAGPGPGLVPHAPGPRGPGMGMGMGMGLGRGGPAGGCALCCPFGAAPGGLPRLGWWLDLTADQVKQIDTIYQNAQADANTAAEAVVAARDALHQAVTTGASEEQIRTAAANLGTAIGNQAALAAKTLASAKAVLTDAQRQQLEKIQAQPTPPGPRRGPGAGRGLGGGWNRGAGGPPWQRVPQQP
jgi:hypothetical protein